MAAAAAGAGAGAAQEKQFPPALLSFFIYNPRFGPREGEGGCRMGSGPGSRGARLESSLVNSLIDWPLPDCFVLGVRQGPDNDKVYSSVLQQCYSMYKLFNGTFLRAMEDGGVKLLKERLEKFFHRYLQTLHLQSCDLLDIFGGISFFPLDKMTYLKIQSFINRVEESLSIPTLDFCRRLDSVVGPQLTVLASDICEQFNINKRVSGSEKEPQFKFIYFNHMNLAEKSTIHMRKTPSVSLTSVHPDLMKILGDINSDFTRVDEDEEIIVKAMSDYWVVGKKSDQRELYVILNQKNANLIEVN
ncbi:CCZ1, partial [Cervus elaphus hippelaphus]